MTLSATHTKRWYWIFYGTIVAHAGAFIFGAWLHIALSPGPTTDWTSGGQPIAATKRITAGTPSVTFGDANLKEINTYDAVASDSSGNSAYFWIDKTTTAARAQLLNASGVQQWGTTGVTFATSGNGIITTSGLIAASDGGSGFIAVYESSPGPHLYAVHLNASGTVVDGPTLVVTAAPCGATAFENIQNSAPPFYLNNFQMRQILPDGSGGVFVAYRRGGAGGACISRLNGSLAEVSGWTGGQVVALSGESGELSIIPDGSGGVFFNDRYQDPGDGFKYKLVANHVTAGGTVDCGLATLIANIPGIDYIFAVAANNAPGEAILFWTDLRDFGTLSHEVYAQKINSSCVEQWAPSPGPGPGVAVISTSGSDSTFGSPVPDGAGGAVMLGYMGPSFTTVAVRVDSSGGLPWGVNGVTATSSGGFPIYFSKVGDGSNDFFLTIYDSSTTIKVQRLLNATGARLYGTAGTVVQSVSGHTLALRSQTDDGSGGLIIAESIDTSHVFAQHVSTSGVGQWNGAYGAMVSNGSTSSTPVANEVSQQDQLMASDSAGNYILAWSDARTDGTDFDVYIQKYDPAGVPQWGASTQLNGALSGGESSITVDSTAGFPSAAAFYLNGTIVSCSSVTPTSFEGCVGAPAASDNSAVVQDAIPVAVLPTNSLTTSGDLITDGTDVYVGWKDRRNGPGHTIYVQKFNASGVAQWATNGVAFSTSALGDDMTVNLVPDGSGGVIGTWINTGRNPSVVTYGQRVNSSGVVVWTVDGALLQNVNLNGGVMEWSHTLASDGAGGAWISAISPSNDAYVRHVSSAGVVVATIPVRMTGPAAEDPYAIISDGAGGVIMVWEDDRSSNRDLYAQRVSAAGALLWQVSGVPIVVASGQQTLPHGISRAKALVSDGAGGVIVGWRDERSFPAKIYTQRIDGTGLPRWQTNGVLTASAATFSSVVDYSMASDGAGGAVLAWVDAGSGTVRATELAAATGNRSWGPEVAVGTNAHTYTGINQVSVAYGSSAVVSWAKDVGGERDVYAQHLSFTPPAAPPAPPADVAQSAPEIPTAQWDADGQLIASGDDLSGHVELTGYHGRSQLVKDQDGNFVVFYVDESARTIRGQKFAPDGSILWPTGAPVPEGKLVVPIPDYFGVPDVSHVAAVTDDANGFHLIMDLNDGGAPVGYGTPYWGHVNSDGDLDNLNQTSYSFNCGSGNAPTYFSDGFTNAMIPDGSGGVFVGWISENAGLTNICVQHIDISGGWSFNGGDGTFISSGVVIQGPELAADGFGGVYLAYSEIVSPTRVRTAHLNSVGALTPGCPGIVSADHHIASAKLQIAAPPPSAPQGQDHRPLIISDNGGGAYVVWEDDRVVGGSGSRNIFARRINGACSDSWGAAVNIATDTATLNPLRLDAIMLSPAGFYASVTSVGSPSTVHVVNVNGIDGSMAWAGGTDGVAVATGETSNSFLTPSTGGDALVTFDKLFGVGDLQTYTQRLASADGAIQFPAAGTYVTSGRDAALANVITDGADGAFFSLNSSQNGGDVYVGYVDSTGTRVPGWNSAGVLVANTSLTLESQDTPFVVIDSDDNSIVVWRDLRNNNSSGADIYAQKYDPTGAPLWGAGTPVTISDALGDQVPESVFTDGVNVYIGWTDTAANGYDTVVQKLGADGNAVWAPGGVSLTTDPNQQVNVDIVSDGNGGLIGTWIDFRFGPGIFAQRVTSAGSTDWLVDGVQVIAATASGSLPRIATDDAGGAFIVWTDSRNSNADIFLQRLSADGLRYFAAGGIAVHAATWSTDYPSMVADGFGGVIITFNESGPDAGGNVVAQRVNADGDTLWPDDGAQVANQQPNNESWAANGSTLVADGTGGAVIVYGSYTEGAVRAQRLRADGSKALGDTGVAVSDAGTWDGTPYAVTDDGRGNAVIAYRQSGNLYVTQLDRVTGDRQFDPSLTAVDLGIGMNGVRLARGPGPIGPSYSVVWADTRNDPTTGTTDVFGQHFLTPAPVTTGHSPAANPPGGGSGGEGGGPICGNALCDAGETLITCPSDCVVTGGTPSISLTKTVSATAARNLRLAPGDQMFGIAPSANAPTIAPTRTKEEDTGPASLHFEIAADNSGTGPAYVVKIADPLPEGIEYVPGTMMLNGKPLSDAIDGDTGNYEGATRTLRAIVSTLQAGESATLTFDVTVKESAAGNVRNKATGSYRLTPP